MFQYRYHFRQKALQIERDLKRLIREMGPRAKLPTIKELRSRYNVAIGTLISALDTLEAQGLIDRQRGRGIYVSAGVTHKRVALVFGNKNPLLPGASPFYGALLQACERRAADGDERFSFYIGSPAMGQAVDTQAAEVVHHDLAQALYERAIDGMILVSRDSDLQEKWLRSQDIPVMTYDRWDSEARSPGQVFVDLEAMVRGSADALMGQGCRTLGVLGARHEHCDLLRGLQQRMGFTLNEDWVISPPAGDHLLSSRLAALGREAAMEAMLRSGWSSSHRNRDLLPDGLLITNDTLASGALPHLSRMGIRAGIEMKIASHANKGSNQLLEWEPGMILAEFDTDEIVRAIFEGLEPLMMGKSLRHPYVAVQPTMRICPLDSPPNLEPE